MYCCVPLPSAANLSLWIQKVLLHHIFNPVKTFRQMCMVGPIVLSYYFLNHLSPFYHRGSDCTSQPIYWGDFSDFSFRKKIIFFPQSVKTICAAISSRARLFQRGSVHLRDSNSLHICHLYSKIFSENMLFLESHFSSTSDTHSFTPFLRSTSCQNAELLHSYFNLYATLTSVSKYL